MLGKDHNPKLCLHPLFIIDKNSYYIAQEGLDLEYESLCPAPWLP